MNLKWLARPFISKPIPHEALPLPRPRQHHTSPDSTKHSNTGADKGHSHSDHHRPHYCLLSSSLPWGLLTSALYRPSLGQMQEVSRAPSMFSKAHHTMLLYFWPLLWDLFHQWTSSLTPNNHRHGMSILEGVLLKPTSERQTGCCWWTNIKKTKVA